MSQDETCYLIYAIYYFKIIQNFPLTLFSAEGGGGFLLPLAFLSTTPREINRGC